MAFIRSIRAGLVMTAFACAVVEAQTLPATAPTAPQKTVNPADRPAQRADVKYSTGLLTVSADNSSLNQILRDIGRATGMKITGGVTDERVYGSYGPADTSTVISALLKGTGSNMLLVLGGDQSPRELVLTPRGGGPTPPSPNAGRERDEEDLPPQRMPHNPRMDGAGFQSQPNQPPQPPFNPPQPPPTYPTQLQIAPQTPPAPSASDTTTQSPNGVKTPQEIYDQLLKLQQQKSATPTTPPQ